MLSRVVAKALHQRGGYRISDKGELLMNNKTSVCVCVCVGAAGFRQILRAGVCGVVAMVVLSAHNCV